MADRVVVMEKGRVSQVAPPLELYERPANLFVATFIGAPSMNLLPVTLEQSGLVRFANGAVFVPPSLNPNLRPGQQVILGIRPEDLTRGDDGIPASIHTVEPLGAMTHIHAELGGQMVTAQLPPSDRVRHGDSISLRPNLSKAHWFSPETGLRIADV